MNVKNLPDWAKYNKAGDIIIIDPDVVYPLYLEKLGYDEAKVTQAQLETARLCFTEDLFQVTGKGLKLRILKSPDDKWRLTHFPAGKPINWASEYKRISA